MTLLKVSEYEATYFMILHFLKAFNCKLSVPVTVHREQSVKSEKTNRMQQSDVYYQLLSQHVLGIIMPIFRRTKTVCYCIWCTALVLLVVRCRMRAPLASYNAAPHNRYQPHPAEPEQYTVCSNTIFVLLKMGIMMPEIC